MDLTRTSLIQRCLLLESPPVSCGLDTSRCLAPALLLNQDLAGPLGTNDSSPRLP